MRLISAFLLCFFAHVHHQHLVNLLYVAKYLRGRGGTIVMTDGVEIQVSYRKKEAFLRLIGAGS